MTYQGFGDGSDGVATLSGTDAPIDSSCSGASGGTSLAATNASFATGKIILIHQSRGTGAGSWEYNFIDTYTPGTITTQFPLVNTYTDSGASQAQVIQIRQYSKVTVSGTLTAKAWDGDVGGILIIFCSGDMVVSGAVTASAKGFRPGNFGGDNAYSYQGESATGLGVKSYTANGMGGGSSYRQAFNSTVDSAGGGGHAASGISGSESGTTGTPGQAGGTGGAADMTIMLFGGAGGTGGDAGTGAGNGGRSGAIIIIAAGTLTVTGIISNDGGVGGNASGGTGTGAGGGGAGGSTYIVSRNAILGSGLVTALGGLGGSANQFCPAGGPGAIGRIRIECCERTGSTNPSASESIGGHDFCQSFIHIY